MPAHGIMFHHFHSESHQPTQGSIDRATLRALIKHIGLEWILPAAEFHERALAGTLPQHARCLTFDDGLRCQYDVALPVLRDFKLTAFWFVSTGPLTGEPITHELHRAFRDACYSSRDPFYLDFEETTDSLWPERGLRGALDAGGTNKYLAEFDFYTPIERRYRYLRDRLLKPDEVNQVVIHMAQRRGAELERFASRRWMTGAMLRELHATGHVIGLHSHSHPTALANLPPEAQRREYAINQSKLRILLGEEPTAVGHPCNSYTPTTLEILRELGVRLGFRANMASTDGSLLELPREDHMNLVRAMNRCELPSSRAISDDIFL